ncbi:hypothetical protein GALMADRAFT_1201028 [Galerina marginata CBS 339.88]|uniref:Uncharacterized protein n=1 Tax=Galerina marginata (strain CBS 339.88) TaxID=685588 RepID=A0A067TNE8_GALM3|nr:hypothetical protein GALMADRAFT_1201028 [Galerina marginata CBS 339.88]
MRAFVLLPSHFLGSDWFACRQMGENDMLHNMSEIPKKRKTVREPTYNSRPTRRSKQTVSSPELFDVRFSPAAVQANRPCRPTCELQNMERRLSGLRP